MDCINRQIIKRKGMIILMKACMIECAKSEKLMKN